MTWYEHDRSASSPLMKLPSLFKYLYIYLILKKTRQSLNTIYYTKIDKFELSWAHDLKQSMNMLLALALFLCSQPLVTKWISISSRQQAYQKLPYSMIKKSAVEDCFWTISVLTKLTGFQVFQPYMPNPNCPKKSN